MDKIRELILVLNLTTKSAYSGSNNNEDTRALVSPQSSIESQLGATGRGGRRGSISLKSCHQHQQQQHHQHQLDSLSIDSAGLDGVENRSSLLPLQRGLLLAAASSFFFSLCSTIVKQLDYMHPGELACLRFIGIFMCTLPYVLARGLPLLGPREVRGLLVLRGLAGSTSLYLRFCALHYLPLADASVIIFSVPVFVALMAKVFLNEPCSLFHWVSISFTMVGIALITKMPFLFGHHAAHSSEWGSTSSRVADGVFGGGLDLHAATAAKVDSSSVIISSIGDGAAAVSSHGGPATMSDYDASVAEAYDELADDSTELRLYGTMAALASTFFSASVYVLLRKLRDTDPFVVLLNLGWIAVIETALLTLALGRFTSPRTGFDQLLVIALGLFSFFGQVCLTRALQGEQAGPVAVVRSSADIALAFLWEVLFFSVMPDRWSVSGAILVSACVIVTGLRKWLLSLPESSAIRRRLCMLTI